MVSRCEENAFGVHNWRENIGGSLDKSSAQVPNIARLQRRDRPTYYFRHL